MNNRIPIFVLTDADVHGIRIAECYERSLPQLGINWLGVRPSHNGTYFNISSQALLPLSESERSLLRSGLSSRKRSGDSVYWLEMKTLICSGYKFEMEAVSALDTSDSCSGLLKYILRRLAENRCCLESSHCEEF